MILPDTHSLLWFMNSSPRLGREANLIIRRATDMGIAAFSAISVWEVALLLSKSRLALDVTAAQWRQNLLSAGLAEIPVDGVIAARSVALPDFHADPADRILNWSGPLNRFPAHR